MVTCLKQGYVLRVVVLLYFASHVSTYDFRKQICTQFKRCFYSSPLCLVLFGYYRCMDFRNYGGTEPVCGVSTVTGRASSYPFPKVVGGIDAQEREFPWTVYLNSGCGGTVIDSTTILTAAHCVRGRINNPSQLNVGYGSVNRTLLEYVPARDIILHPNFDSQNNNNDLAIVKLNQSLPLDEATNLRSICLPEFSRTYRADRNCIITGWGALVEGGFQLPRILQKASVPLVPLGVCQNVYANNDAIFVSERQLCAGYITEGGVSACQGDSGGPLFCPDGDRWVLEGIISTGQGCARPGYPGVYAYVPQFVTWIREHMNPR